MNEDMRKTRKEAIVTYSVGFFFRHFSSKNPTKDNHENLGRNSWSVRQDAKPEPVKLEGTITTTT
jgi:hypothetical protein